MLILEACTTIREPLIFIGRIVLAFKIVIPILIIIFGMIDFGRSIVNDKDVEFSKPLITLLKRALAGIVIFLIPTVVSVVFSMVNSFLQIRGDFDACQKCVLRVRDCE